MDKQTLSFSSVFGIIGDAHLIGREYSLLGSMVLYVINSLSLSYNLTSRQCGAASASASVSILPRQVSAFKIHSLHCCILGSDFGMYVGHPGVHWSSHWPTLCTLSLPLHFHPSGLMMMYQTKLGAFEASIQPAFILVGQIWYRRHEQGFRVAGKHTQPKLSSSYRAENYCSVVFE